MYGVTPRSLRDISRKFSGPTESDRGELFKDFSALHIKFFKATILVRSSSEIADFLRDLRIELIITV